MRLLQSMLQSADVSRFGWTLVHSLWEGAAVAVLLAIALFILRSQSSQSRYLASCAAMGLLLVLPIGTFLVLKPASLPTIQPISFAAHSAPAGAETDRSAKPDGLQRVAGAVRVERVTPEIEEPSKDSPAVASLSAPIRARVRAQDVLPWLVIIWAVGVAAMSLWNLGGWIALQRLRSNGTKPTSREIQQQLSQLCTRLGMRRAVRIFESARVRSPLMIGVFKPIILLPASIICELPAAQLESILSHELAHIRRHDYLVNLIQGVIETLVFFHPTTWWISRVIRTERENCCDDVAIGMCRDRATYASALANIAASRSSKLALAAGGGILVARIRRVLGVADTRSHRTGGWAVGAMGLMFIGIIVMLAIAPHSRAQDAKPTTRPAATQLAGNRTIRIKFILDDTGEPAKAVKGSYWPNHQTMTNIRPYTSDTNGEFVAQIDSDVRTFSFFYTQEGYLHGLMALGQENTGAEVPDTYTLRLKRGVTVGGIVLDQDDKPVVGAAIQLTFNFTDPSMPSHIGGSYGSSKTDASGKWTFTGAPKEVTRVEVFARHPDLVLSSMSQEVKPVQYAEMLNQTLVSHVRQGIIVSGTVLDPDGKPVAGASVGPNGVGLINTVNSNAAGDFEAHGIEPGPAQFIVTAKGFPPQLIKYVADDKMQPLTIKLEQGRTINGRVIDSHGKPVSDAYVMVDRWRGISNPGFRIALESDGTFTWDAPNDEFTLTARRPGNFSRQIFTVGAKDTEVVLKLQANQVMRGRVVDDQTGKPIANFSVHVDASSAAERGGWSFDRGGSKGLFVLGATNYADHVSIRITAAGYLPAESGELTPTDDVFRFDARLKKGGGMSGSVVTADGKPARDAQVLLLERMGARLDNGVLDSWSSTASINSLTDATGRFELPKREGQIRLLIIHDTGWLVLHQAASRGLENIKLRPWCTIEGTALRNGKPAAGQKITLRLFNDRDDKNYEKQQFFYDTYSDGAGHFKFTHVADGPLQIGFEIESLMADGRKSFRQSQVHQLRLAPGEHLDNVYLGGNGQTIVGSVIPSEDLIANHEMANEGTLTLRRPNMVPPVGWEEFTEQQKKPYRDAYEASDEMKAYNARTHEYSFGIQKDGTFRIEDVAPGDYQLWIDLQKPKPGQPNFYHWVAVASKDVKIAEPSEHGGRPINVGTLKMVDLKTLGVGDAAPDFDVPTLDGKRLKLSDLRGKYVLVDFWATWCGPCVAEFPTLKQLQAKYSNDPRFVIVGLSVDSFIDLPKRFIASRQITWPQGYIDDESGTAVRMSWGVEGYPTTLLIGPDGKVLKTNLEQKNLIPAVNAALSNSHQ